MVGRWEQGIFVEGTLRQAILVRDTLDKDSYSSLDGMDQFPLQCCTADLQDLINSYKPDCTDLYFADLQFKDGKFDILEPVLPLCPKKGGPENGACYVCPMDDYPDLELE